jgi:hypothetical protein
MKGLGALAKRAPANSFPNDNDMEELVEELIDSINGIRMSTQKPPRLHTAIWTAFFFAFKPLHYLCRSAPPSARFPSFNLAKSAMLPGAEPSVDACVAVPRA